MTALATLPAPYDADVAAYAAALDAAGIRRPAEWVERVALNPAAGTAGTIDRIVTGPWGPLPRIADLKTGSGADRLSYAVQLAIYAHSTHLLAIDGQSWEPMPAVDLETALIFHLPAGSATCEIVEVDIAKGWELVQLCLAVREARKTKGLFRATNNERPTNGGAPSGPVDLSSGVVENTVADPARVEWIRGRVRAVAGCDNPKAKELLAAHWPAGVARKADEWGAADLDRLHDLLHAVEVLDDVPFPAEDPAIIAERERAEAEAIATEAAIVSPLDGEITDDTGPADDAAIAELVALVATMADAEVRRAAWWERQGRTHGRPWSMSGDGTTARIATINAAALACAIHLDDDATRCAIEAATGWDLQPTWPTGALLGSLTITAAEAVRLFADLVGGGDEVYVADLSERLAVKFSNTNHTNQEQQ